MTRTFTGAFDFEHPVTGQLVDVEVAFQVHRAEPDVGIFHGLPEVTGSTVTCEGQPAPWADAEADSRIDDLGDDWFLAIADEEAQADAEDHADWRRGEAIE